jgi:hypothetical protein
MVRNQSNPEYRTGKRETWISDETDTISQEHFWYWKYGLAPIFEISNLLMQSIYLFGEEKEAVFKSWKMQILQKVEEIEQGTKKWSWNNWNK